MRLAPAAHRHLLAIDNAQMIETTASRFHYDPFSPEAMRDPHSFYPVLREDHPAYYIPQYDTWVFSRFQDVWDGFMDAKHFSEAEGQV